MLCVGGPEHGENHGMVRAPYLEIHTFDNAILEDADTGVPKAIIPVDVTHRYVVRNIELETGDTQKVWLYNGVVDRKD